MDDGVLTVADEVLTHLATARAAMEKVRDAELFRCMDSEALEVVREVEALMRLGYTLQVATAADVVERHLAEALSAPSTPALLRQVLLISTAEARSRVAAAHATLAHPLPTDADAPLVLPELATALAAGAVGSHQTRIIVAAMAVIARKTNPDIAAMCETVLVEQAAELDPHALQRIADHLLAMADSDGAEPDDTADKVELHIGTRRPDGLTPIRGLLDDIGIETLRQVIESLTAPSSTSSPAVGGDSGAAGGSGDNGRPGTERADPSSADAAHHNIGDGDDADCDEAHDYSDDCDEAHDDDSDEAHDDGTAGPGSHALSGPVSTSGATTPGRGPAAPGAVGDTRGPAARRAHALTEALRRFLDRGLGPQDGGSRPHIAVTISYADLVSGLGAATLDYGSSIPAWQARMLACDAQIIPAVLGSRSEPLDVGRAARTVTPAIRRALYIRDRGCVWPGCDRPPAWCDAHHLAHWVDLGETSTQNTALLCRYHHDQIHVGHWQIHLSADHHAELIPPSWIDPQRVPRRNKLHHIISTLRI